MKKIYTMIIAVCMLPILAGTASPKETVAYGLPDFYVRVDQEQEEIEYLNSADADAYPVGEIPKGTVLHVTDLVYNREEGTFWALVSYEGMTGWIDLSLTFILRETSSVFPEEQDRKENAEQIPDDENREMTELIVFVSVEEELELMASPGEEEPPTVIAKVTDTTPLYYYGEEYISEGSDYSWFLVSVPDGKTGWVRADQVIMASSQVILEEKEKLREEERRRQQEEDPAGSLPETESAERTGESSSEGGEIVSYGPEYVGNFVDDEEGRIITICEEEIINQTFDPDTGELISESSYYYIARPATLRAEEASEESIRFIAFNQEDPSDVWILFYDPFVPDQLQEEYKTGEKQADKGIRIFSRAENQLGD